MKKILAVLLCLSMICMCAVGCSSGEDSTATTNSVAQSSTAADAPEVTNESVATAPSEEATTEESPLEEAPDDVVSGYDFSAVLPLSETPATISALAQYPNLMGPLSELNISEFSQFEYWDYLVEQTNVDVDFQYVSFLNWTDQLNLFIASGDYTDMVFSIFNSNFDYIAQEDAGFVLDLTDYVEEYAPNYYNRVLSYGYEAKVQDGGKWLKFSSFYDEFRQNQGIVLRQDWLDALNLTVPETWDEYYEVLLAFKTEYNPERVVYINSECNLKNFGGYEFPLYTVGTPTLPYYQIDGEVHCSLTEDCYKEYLQEMNKWYQDGIIMKDFMSYSDDADFNLFNEWIATNQLGCWSTSTEGFSTMASLEVDEGFEVVPVTGPVEEAGTVRQCDNLEITDSSCVILTTGCEDIELTMKWMDYWYTNEGMRTFNYGIEDVDYTLNGDAVEFTDFVLNNEYDLAADQFLRARCPFGSFTGVMIRTRTAFQYSEQQLDAWDLWTSVSVDGERAIPSGVTLSADDTNERNALAVDIATYADETIPKFIMGELNFEEDWDSFVSNCEQMELSRCIELTQSAYDAYVQ